VRVNELLRQRQRRCLDHRADVLRAHGRVETEEVEGGGRIDVSDAHRCEQCQFMTRWRQRGTSTLSRPTVVNTPGHGCEGICDDKLRLMQQPRTWHHASWMHIATYSPEARDGSSIQDRFSSVDRHESRRDSVYGRRVGHGPKYRRA
jgi:hypothetical protein